MTNEDLMAILKKVPLFARVPVDELKELVNDSHVVEAKCHKILFMQDDPAEHFYIVIDGWVKLFRQTKDGDEAVIEVITRGQSFAEAAIFEKQNFPVSAECVTDALLVAIKGDSFISRIERQPDFAMQMLASMSRRLRTHIALIERLVVKSTSERLGDFLLSLCRTDSDPEIIHLPYDKTLVAARLGMKPETLSRALAKLRSIGVETHGHEVVVKSHESLRNFCRAEDNSKAV
ncbi:MAG: Crp/Fnr family transcriptional regulator, partial [Rhodospirillaceae bacterium]|nr:Crp/Fnr family transcriptional regulator [Rhodospirillaceae bacterium]